MCRWWVALVLALGLYVPAARAQPVPPAVVTAQAQGQVTSAELRVRELEARRAVLLQRYNAETEAIKQLKKQKRSWRTDRQLEEQLAAAKETADQLRAITDQLAAAQAQLGRARTALGAAIDAELEAAPVGPRAEQLAAMRARIAPRRAVHRIVMPDTRYDPNADPEELDEQAAAIRESEAELARQVAMLDSQGKELERIDYMRKQHDRTRELDQRDDNTPRRAPAGGGRNSPAAQDSFGGGPGRDGDGGSGESGVPPSNPTFDDTITQLANVVDISVTNDLSRAQRSGDPGQRAAAAKKARDAVQERLELLRQMRAKIEKAAKDKRKRSELLGELPLLS